MDRRLEDLKNLTGHGFDSREGSFNEKYPILVEIRGGKKLPKFVSEALEGLRLQCREIKQGTEAYHLAVKAEPVPKSLSDTYVFNKSYVISEIRKKSPKAAEWFEEQFNGYADEFKFGNEYIKSVID